MDQVDIAEPVNRIVSDLPTTLGHLHPSSSTALHFYHPKYIDLLLELPLDEHLASIVVDFYQREGLCLPFASNWIKNIWRLLESLKNLPSARRRVSTLLFSIVYPYTEDFADHRAELLERLIIPYLERSLTDADDESTIEALEILVRAAVAETLELDETHDDAASVLPSAQLATLASSGNFNAIRTIIIKLAVQTPCSGSSETSARLASHDTVSATAKGPEDPHTQCRSIHAVLSLIAIFTRLSFSPSSPSSLVERTPITMRSVTIYRDLLGLLYPMTDDSGGKIPARCPKSRIVILQWLTRIRADSKQAHCRS
jgi:hypothetical protein